MLGLDNPIHILFLLGLLLLVFGAKRLPEMGRSLGTGLRGFKESLTTEDHHSALSAEAELPLASVSAAQPSPTAAADAPAVSRSETAQA